MAQIPSLIARGLLRTLARDAKNNGKFLEDAINDLQDLINSPSFRQGRILASTSGNGQSAAWQQAQTYAAEFTPAKIAAQVQEFAEVYEFCVAAGTITENSDPEQDYRAMCNDDRLQTINRRRSDFTLLNWPQTGMLNG